MRGCAPSGVEKPAPVFFFVFHLKAPFTCALSPVFFLYVTLHVFALSFFFLVCAYACVCVRVLMCACGSSTQLGGISPGKAAAGALS